MRFNWHKYPIYLGEEILKSLGGEYTKWNTLLKQIRFTRAAVAIVTYCIIFFSILSNQLREFTINELSGVGKNKFQQITWSNIFHETYLDIEKADGLDRDKLFLISIYVLIVKSAIFFIALLVGLYIYKLHQSRSIWIRHRMPGIPWELRDQIKWTAIWMSIIPFPIRTYQILKKWNLPSRTRIIAIDKAINIFSEQQKFPPLPNTKRPYALVKVKNLSFMYHGDNEWDKWFHTFLKQYFPHLYRSHILKKNTIHKSQELEKTNLSILKNVALHINSGKFTTILGCNGSSKSTLVKLIIKLFEKYSGQISWNRKDLRNISTKSFYKNVAYISQENIIHNEISVYDYVACGLFPSFKFFKFHYSQNNPIILENLKKMEILQYKDKNIKKLSGGEKQKAILARVLTQRTPVIILDEPTTYLDINNQYKILNILKKLQLEENKTIIAILHDIQQAKQFSDDVILMEDGKVFDYGPANKVLNSENIKKVFGIENL